MANKITGRADARTPGIVPAGKQLVLVLHCRLLNRRRRQQNGSTRPGSRSEFAASEPWGRHQEAGGDREAAFFPGPQRLFAKAPHGFSRPYPPPKPCPE